MQAWDYFKNIHGRNGLNGDGGEIRIKAERSDVTGAVYFSGNSNTDHIVVGWGTDGTYYGELSVIAHEFTHGVDQTSGDGGLNTAGESGALDESFADIFGILTRRYATGILNWEFGVHTAEPTKNRNLQNPKSLGFHVISPSITEILGQPDTYQGLYWHTPTENFSVDNGDVHINNGVQNHWFYILSQGKTNTNDLGNSYNVSGIGVDEASKIAYYNLTNNMQYNSQYIDAMEGAIIYSFLKYGICSFEHIQTQNAWYAVGLGSSSSCEGASINENNVNFDYYPNPAMNNINLVFSNEQNRTIEIYSINGSLITRIENVETSKLEINLSNYSKGTYIINVIGADVQRIKFVKH